jgi:predicted transcriptional regulator
MTTESPQPKHSQHKHRERVSNFALNNLFLLCKHGPKTAAELAEVSAVYAHGTVKAGLSELAKKKLVDTWSDGRRLTYAINEAGLKMLDQESSND